MADDDVLDPTACLRLGVDPDAEQAIGTSDSALGLSAPTETFGPLDLLPLKHASAVFFVPNGQANKSRSRRYHCD
jgi:hypothetical protein